MNGIRWIRVAGNRSSPVGHVGDFVAGQSEKRAMGAVRIDQLEPTVPIGFGVADCDCDALAVGRPACRGCSVSGREDATAILAVDIDDPDALAVLELQRAVTVEQLAGRRARSERRTGYRPR